MRVEIIKFNLLAPVSNKTKNTRYAKFFGQLYDISKNKIKVSKTLIKLLNPFHINPSRVDPGRREAINLNFNFHTSLWYFKKFYEGFKGFHKTL